MNKPRKDILRAGDWVKVIDPRVVLRVGYPKQTKDYLEEVRMKHRSMVEALFHSRRLRERCINLLAYQACSDDGFGGSHRAVILSEPIVGLQGVTRVIDKARTVVTGRYYPPESSRSYYGECDYEPGGLADRQYVRLVTVSFQFGYVELPAAHCERASIE